MCPTTLKRSPRVRVTAGSVLVAVVAMSTFAQAQSREPPHLPDPPQTRAQEPVPGTVAAPPIIDGDASARPPPSQVVVPPAADATRTPLSGGAAATRLGSMPAPSVLRVTAPEPMQIALVPHGTRAPRPGAGYYCTTPCDVPVPPGWYVLIADQPNGTRTSGPVFVTYGRSVVTIVPPRNAVEGRVLVGFGAATMVGGVLVALAGGVSFGSTCSVWSCSPSSRPIPITMIVGPSMFAVGGIALAVGAGIVSAAGGRVRWLGNVHARGTSAGRGLVWALAPTLDRAGMQFGVVF